MGPSIGDRDRSDGRHVPQRGDRRTSRTTRHRFLRQVRVDVVAHTGDADPGIHRTFRGSGSRAKVQNRSQLHISRRPSGGRCWTQSSKREWGAERCDLSLYRRKSSTARHWLPPPVRFMKVVQRFVCLFHRAKRPLHLPFGPGGGAAAIVATRQMRDGPQCPDSP